MNEKLKEQVDLNFIYGSQAVRPTLVVRIESIPVPFWRKVYWDFCHFWDDVIFPSILMSLSITCFAVAFHGW